jgi:uncharacterized iron-regulated membrane protein
MTSPDLVASTRARNFYLALWRWHFYAGICVLPFIAVLALSGLAMLASEPLDRYLRSDLYEIAPAGAVLPASAQAAAVTIAYPHDELATIRLSADPAESTRIDVSLKHAAGKHGMHGVAGVTTVFVDPYTGEVLGDQDPNRTLYAWAKGIHGTLLLGTVGDYLIEIVAGFAVLLVVSGLYLWWPRDGRTLWGVLFPRVAGRGRPGWRDLHGAIGVWIAPVLLFFLISGLAWTPFWGGALVQAWNSLPGEQFRGARVEQTHQSLNHGARHTMPWALEQTPLPASGSSQGAIDLDQVVAWARDEGFSTFRVHWPRGEQGAWTVAATTIGGDTTALRGDRIAHLDAGTGAVLAEIRYADYSPMGKFMAAGVPFHQGDTGAANVAINAAFCVAVLGLVGAAVTAWWVRRPTGTRRLVPPPLPHNLQIWRGAVVLMLALSPVPAGRSDHPRGARGGQARAQTCARVRGIVRVDLVISRTTALPPPTAPAHTAPRPDRHRTPCARSSSARRD